VQELRAHHQVVVEEVRRVLAVGADPADFGRQVNDHLGLDGGKQQMDVRQPSQVEFFDYGNKRRAPHLASLGDVLARNPPPVTTKRVFANP
jgi:hypothetical protein